MSQRQPNLIDKLAGLIPGYRGYADRDARRGADKRLRESVATLLTAARRDVHDVVLRRVETGRLNGLDALDRMAQELGMAADALRYAPAGGSGLMDDIAVTAADLDRVHRHDLDVQLIAQDFCTALSEACATGDAEAVLALRPRIRELREAVARREGLFHQIFD